MTEQTTTVVAQTNALAGPTDAMAPWTIKSVALETREAVTKAARQEGVTVGQWLERRVREWLEDGQLVTVSPGKPGSALVSNAGKPAAPAADTAAAAVDLVRLAVELASVPAEIRDDAMVRAARGTVKAMLGRLRT